MPEAKRPLALLTIRSASDVLVKFTIFTYFQNGVDYLNTIGASWEKIGDNQYKTRTGYIVRVEMIVPEYLDLRKEEYLWVTPETTKV